MSKESGFDPFGPVKGISNAAKQEVSEQMATTALKTVSKLLRRTGKETASNVAANLDKIAKRTSRE